jgi:hypothetical protein
MGLYHNQPAMKKLKELKEKYLNDKDNPDRDIVIWLELDNYQYIENAKNNSFVTFALVKDSKWYERGEMGWLGCVSKEMNKKEWNNKFCSLLLDLPDETLISLYDCHI